MLDIATLREFLKDSIRQKTDFRSTDQQQGVPPPPAQLSVPEGHSVFELPKFPKWQHVDDIALMYAIKKRRSIRAYQDKAVTIDHLAWLLWSTQGVRMRPNETVTMRTVPSAGARHAFETYLCIQNVETLEPGIYRYQPLDHALVQMSTINAAELPTTLEQATLGQTFIGKAPVVFIWAAVPYRMEWRYGTAAHKVMLLDAGHIAQNLYLACTAIGAGTCAIAAYDQEKMDHLIGLDGNDQFTTYLAPVGYK